MILDLSIHEEDTLLVALRIAIDFEKNRKEMVRGHYDPDSVMVRRRAAHRIRKFNDLKKKVRQREAQ